VELAYKLGRSPKQNRKVLTEVEDVDQAAKNFALKWGRGTEAAAKLGPQRESVHPAASPS